VRHHCNKDILEHQSLLFPNVLHFNHFANYTNGLAYFMLRVGRYVSSFSKRSTHLVVPSDVGLHNSAKITLASHIREKWGTLVVSPAWVMSSASCSKRLREEDFAVSLDRASPESSAPQESLRNRRELKVKFEYRTLIMPRHQSRVTCTGRHLLIYNINLVRQEKLLVNHRHQRGEAGLQARSQRLSRCHDLPQDESSPCRK
jgi:hypothetical protein